jgi:hypothetical protein
MSKIVILIGEIKDVNIEKDDIENLVKKAEDQILKGETVIFHNTKYNSNIIKRINELAKKHNSPIIYRLVISKL